MKKILEFIGIEDLNKWRSGWDSNPRPSGGIMISSHVRYDHFDTAPYSVGLCATKCIILYYFEFVNSKSENFLKNIKIIYKIKCMALYFVH